jgi:hypothetical protein
VNTPAADAPVVTAPVNGANAATSGAVDTRSRELQRSRERDPR